MCHHALWLCVITCFDLLPLSGLSTWMCGQPAAVPFETPWVHHASGWVPSVSSPICQVRVSSSLWHHRGNTCVVKLVFTQKNTEGSLIRKLEILPQLSLWTEVSPGDLNPCIKQTVFLKDWFRWADPHWGDLYYCGQMISPRRSIKPHNKSQVSKCVKNSGGGSLLRGRNGS